MCCKAIALLILPVYLKSSYQTTRWPFLILVCTDDIYYENDLFPFHSRVIGEQVVCFALT